MTAAVALAAAVLFDDVARQAGFVHAMPNGGSTTKKYILETTGSGVGLIDYDNDGDLDALLLSSDAAASRLYRNEGRLRFTDVTRQAGLAFRPWAEGVCSGDYDNDGFTDFAVTYYGAAVLYRNRNGARFEAIALPTGAGRYHTGCAFLDYDRDGDLDLAIANYLRFDFATTPLPGANPYCFYRDMAVNCGPRGLPFDRNQLLRNDGGRFLDVSETSGIAKPARHYGLGVLVGDFNRDGWPDIYIACDQTPSLLYINQRDGTFAEEALLRGAALDEHGKALSGMGASAADYDRDGWPDIFRTNFSDERETLYRNSGDGNFDDATAAAGLAHNTAYVGWGCAFFDFDNDGWRDLLLVNGHAFPEVDRLPGPVRYRERAILYRNLGAGKFADVSTQAGPALALERVARGLATGDLDGDGRIEALINNQNDTPTLLRARPGGSGNWIAFDLTGTKSNRSAIGALVEWNGETAEVASGGSYLSQSSLRLHFGLGEAATASVMIRWPSGARQALNGLAANRVHIVREPD